MSAVNESYIISPIKKTIAIVEDDDSINDLIQSSIMLAFDDAEFVNFKNSREAIHELWEKDVVEVMPIDLLFLDIYLNDKTNGLDILEYCQYIPKNVPVVIMSSNFNEENLNLISKTKITPILLKKPFSPSDVINLMRWSLKTKESV